MEYLELNIASLISCRMYMFIFNYTLSNFLITISEDSTKLDIIIIPSLVSGTVGGLWSSEHVFFLYSENQKTVAFRQLKQYSSAFDVEQTYRLNINFIDDFLSEMGLFTC